jgi:hypothetical protein
MSPAGSFLGLAENGHHAAVCIQLETLRLCSPTIEAGLSHCCHSPPNHSYRVIRGDETSAFHLFDDLPPAISGNGRRPMNSLAQCEPAIRADKTLGVRRIRFDVHLLPSVHFGPAGVTPFSDSQRAVHVETLNRLFGDALRGPNVAGLTASCFRPLPSAIQITALVNALVSHHSRTDPPFRELRTLAFRNCFVDSWHQRHGIGSLRTRPDRAPLFDLSRFQAESAIDIGRPGVPDGARVSSGRLTLRLNCLPQPSLARVEPEYLALRLRGIGACANGLGDGLLERFEPAINAWGLDGLDDRLSAAGFTSGLHATPWATERIGSLNNTRGRRRPRLAGCSTSLLSDDRGRSEHDPDANTDSAFTRHDSPPDPANLAHRTVAARDCCQQMEADRCVSLDSLAYEARPTRASRSSSRCK